MVGQHCNMLGDMALATAADALSAAGSVWYFTGSVAASFTKDASLRERLVIAPVLALILLLGFLPNLALNLIEPVAQSTISHVGVPDPVATLGEEPK